MGNEYLKDFLSNPEIWVKVLVSASFFIFFGTIIILLVTNVAKSRRFTFDKKLVLFTCSVTVSIWCLQFFADYVNNDCPATTWYELLVFSFYHTLKSFGADDNLLMGVEDIITFISNYTSLLTADKIVYLRIYATILGFCAPITGATIFFEILSNFFPKVKFWFLRYCFFRKKYYFSELNERSLALAKSILNSDEFLPPAVIFTDVYADKSHENTTELLTEAKRIGAICLRDDITHLQKRGLGGKKFFLIDDNEIKNLQTLTNLTDRFNHKTLKKSEIYLFCQDYIYTDVEKQVREKLKKDYNYTDSDLTIIPVRCYRNLITSMLEKTPLYEPVVSKRAENKNEELDLNVTILGFGDIGTEMFLTTYWMGQMLNCKLNINVISRESEEEFWGKIDYINPEIRYTTYEKHEILRIYKHKDEFADPYCKVKYFSYDIQSEEFRKLLEGEDGHNTILNTHYFLVSLGSDQTNLSAANTLKNRIGKYHIEHKEQNSKTIINYVVYNAALSETLNENKYICSCESKPDIYMQAVGGVEQIYTASNIFMMDYYDSAVSAAKGYDSRQMKADRADANKLRLDDEYKYWANMALRLHFKYKVFSVLPFKFSLFDDEKDYKKNVAEHCLAYKELVRNCKNPEDTEMQNKLSWLEHRRWNAFLRTMGYRHTEDYSKYYGIRQSHKQTDMKLHPCLVECDKNGLHGKLNNDGTVESNLYSAKESDVENFDLLDTLSFDLSKLTKKHCDFKQYDYPNNDYLDNV